MLHGVRDIRSLENVLNDNGGLQIDVFFVEGGRFFCFVFLAESLCPALIAELFAVLFEYIRSQDGLFTETSEIDNGQRCASDANKTHVILSSHYLR